MINIEPEELQALVQRIIDSGELGRSNTYSKILSYLSDCAIGGNKPKELAIAIDVLERDADFDVSQDSTVRVHIYHLRNKLKAYFDKYGKQEKFHLSIPKGQYILTAVLQEDLPTKSVALVETTPDNTHNKGKNSWLIGTAIGLLLINLAFQLYPKAATPSYSSAFDTLSPWKEMFDDNEPVLILIGDYYIFGQENDSGEVVRMVRDFEINSAEDLDFLKKSGLDESNNYADLNLSYTPSSIPYALTQVMQVLMQGVTPERISVKMASEHTTADLAYNHIIYLGYFSGLHTADNLFFAGSNLNIGSSFDELYNINSGDYYVSNSGFSGVDVYKEYGLLSTYSSPNGFQVTMIAGMRDESLKSLAKQATSPEILAQIQESLDSNENTSNFETLFEVIGFDNTSFNSKAIFTEARSVEAIARVYGEN